jgi:hypothetical protein
MMNDKIIQGIRDIRQEWQDATESQDLTQVNGSVGFLLSDLCDKYRLTSGERAEALGNDLYRLLLQVLE